MRAWLVVLIVVLSSTMAEAAEASPPDPRIGLVACEKWLSDPAYQRDGENWVYGFWDGFLQGLGYSGHVGQLPNLDLMLEAVRSNCRDKPSSTLAESASITLEKARQGALQHPSAGKIERGRLQARMPEDTESSDRQSAP